jgi:hypothetical protein
MIAVHFVGTCSLCCWVLICREVAELHAELARKDAEKERELASLREQLEAESSKLLASMQKDKVLFLL